MTRLLENQSLKRSIAAFLLPCLIFAGLRTSASSAKVSVGNGPDWGVQLTQAIGACGQATSCFIDGSNLTPGTAASSVNVTRGGLSIQFPAGTFSLAQGQMFNVTAVPGITLIDQIQISGQGAGKTIFQFQSDFTSAQRQFAFRVVGQREGPFPMNGGYTQGSTQLSVNTSDLQALAAEKPAIAVKADDWIEVGDFGISPTNQQFDNEAYEWVQVAKDVVPGDTVISLKTPLIRSYNKLGRASWFRPYRIVSRPLLKNFSIVNNGNAPALYVSNTIAPVIQYLSITGRSATQLMDVYQSMNPQIIGNALKVQGTKPIIPLELSHAFNGVLDQNTFDCTDQTSGMVMVDFASYNISITNNQFHCRTAQQNGLEIEDADQIVAQGNRFAFGTGATSGYSVGISLVGTTNLTLGATVISGYMRGVAVQNSIQGGLGTGHVSVWAANTNIAASDSQPLCVIPTGAIDGFMYCQISACVTGAQEPVWNKTQVGYGYSSIASADALTDDGSCKWVGTQTHPSTNNQVGTATDAVYVQYATVGILNKAGSVNTFIQNLQTSNVTTPVQGL